MMQNANLTVDGNRLATRQVERFYSTRAPLFRG